MLSDAERRRLTEIERTLRSADPEFVQRFRSLAGSDPHTCWGVTARGWLIAAALGMSLAILMASAVMAVVAFGVAAVSAGLWLTEFRRP
jgi:hypothetical protein